VAEGEGGEGAPGMVVCSAGRTATTLDRRAQAAVLSRNRGEQWGAADAVRARLTGGAGTSRGPDVSGGVREGEGCARQRGGGAPIGGPGQHSGGGAV
jgi:hypothetical protein